MDSFLTELRKIPPVTRFLVASTTAITLPTLLNIVSAYKFIFWKDAIFSRELQIWRLYTSFFLSTSPGLQLLFDLFQLYNLSNGLENGPYRQHPANYGYQLILACAGIIVVSLPLQATVFFRPLLLCIAYVSSNLAPVGSTTSLMGLISLPIIYLPWTMLLIDLLFGGPSAAALGLSGIIVGHLWKWGIWGGDVDVAGGALRHWGVAPRWMVNLIGGSYGAGGDGARENQGPVRVSRPHAAPATARSTGYSWGGGQRLGNT